MSKGWSIGLFVAAFFLMFTLFQLDSETRRRNRMLQTQLEELDLKIGTYIRSVEAEDPKRQLNAMRYSQESLADDFQKSRTTSIELLELLINNDEKFEKELKKIRDDIAELKKQLAL